MRVIQIPKRDGTFRTVVAPNREEKHKLRGYIHQLQDIAEAVCPSDVVHGFWPGRSPVTNAAYHRGFKYTVNFDLRNFFDTVTVTMFSDRVVEAVEANIPIAFSLEVYKDAFIDGIARQGLPTSPVIANIAAAKMDHAFHNFTVGKLIAYTRYADDLTFSMHHEHQVAEVMQLVTATVPQHGFEINEKKTCVQCAAAGRRMVTGVGVDDELHPSRDSKRRLRAAKHRGNKMAATGMAEWCSLKFPAGFIRETKADERTRQKFADLIDLNDELFKKASGP